MVYFRRHRDDDPAKAVPGREFLSSCPAGVRAKVRAGGPKPGGGKGRHHHRLYCLLDYDAQDAGKPLLLVVVTGLDKPFRTTISAQFLSQCAAPARPQQ